MGTALEADNKPEEAIESYVRALAIAPDMADAYFRVGTLYFKEKHTAQALVLLSRAVELAPESEFAREARRQINNLESQFAKELGTTKPSSRPKEENPAATLSPSKPATKADIEASKLKEIKDKQEEAEEKRRKKEEERLHPPEDKPAFSLNRLLKRKEELGKKPAKDMKMFIQQPQEGDLQSKPKTD